MRTEEDSWTASSWQEWYSDSKKEKPPLTSRQASLNAQHINFELDGTQQQRTTLGSTSVSCKQEYDIYLSSNGYFQQDNVTKHIKLVP